MYDAQSMLAIMKFAVQHVASDIHVTVGRPPMLRINGVLNPMSDYPPLTEKDTFAMLNTIMDTKRRTQFFDDGETDFSYELPGYSRFRVNIYKQSGCVAGALRLISTKIPTFEELHLPNVLSDLAMLPRGLILVTGPTGSGKSTTLAAVIDRINQFRKDHIITLEDPIEYKHEHLNSLIDQREVGSDTKSFASGLRAALREDPDVILVGEMRDSETIGTAITAAETGHLVLATLHTLDAASTVDRIIDVFPDHQQQQIRVQLAGNLQGIVAQQLLPTCDKSSRVAAFEILVATPALRNLIREAKTHQINSYIQTGHRYGMITMDASLAELVNKHIVDKDTAEERCYDPLTFERYLQGI